MNRASGGRQPPVSRKVVPDAAEASGLAAGTGKPTESVNAGPQVLECRIVEHPPPEIPRRRVLWFRRVGALRSGPALTGQVVRVQTVDQVPQRIQGLATGQADDPAAVLQAQL